MAAAQNSRKIRSNKLRISCFSFKGCFGCSHREITSSDGKGTQRQTRIRTIPVIHSKFATSSHVFDSSKEVHVVEATDKNSQLVTPQARRDNSHKKHDMVLEKHTNTIHESNREILKTPIKLLHSVSLPLPAGQKIEKWSAGGDRGDELDSTFGALIIMVTLVVILIWGKACAIICSAAWFYFIPRFKASNHEFKVMKLRNTSNHIDFGPREYNKNVVLEGFLQRN